MDQLHATYHSLSLTDMPVTAGALCEALKQIPFAAFYGEMGAGKTTLIKQVVKKLGSDDSVSSPTFSLVNEYETSSGPLYHFDFYRINHLNEVYDLGYEEYFFSGNICLVEWPQRVEALLPLPRIDVHISLNEDNTRSIRWEILH
jgi:tRNA threonylcarbamoyladenosine biosynthesis protein TsaE